MLDATGIDVIREVRVPGGRERADLEGLAESITRSALIQSKYGVFAPYRHLLETDAGEPSLSPTVDAADPHSELIGSFVFRGPDVHRLRDPLETRLSSPGEVLEDAPEIAVPITVTDAGHPEIATTMTRLLEDKNLRHTGQRGSVDLVDTALSADAPYHLAVWVVRVFGLQETGGLLSRSFW